MFKHYERAMSEDGEYIKFGNQDIDTAFSGTNYNLAPDRDISQGEFVRQRCAEVRMQNRKDVNVMCSWVVTAPKDLPHDDERTFFVRAYDFLSERYGKENIVSAYVHMDETTPHMHFAFVPVVEDKKRGGFKLSAKEAVDRKDLQTFHKDLDAYMTRVFGRDIGVLNEATKEGNKSIDELKRGTAAERISEANREAAQIVQEATEVAVQARETGRQILENARQKVEKAQGGIESLEAKEKALQRKIEGLEADVEGRVLKINEITAIQPQRTLTGAIKGVSLEDIENLKQTAIVSLRTTESVQSLTSENKRLKNRIANLESKQPSMKDRMEELKEKSRLLEVEKAFKRLPEDTQRQLMRASRTKDHDRGHER